MVAFFPQKYPVSDLLHLPAAASVAISVGDLLYHGTSGAATRASSQADKLDEEANQAEFAANFAGIANGNRLSTDAVAGTVQVQVDGEIEYPCTSSTFEIGDLVGADEAASGTALEDQSVKKVTCPRLAIGVVTKRYASATTTVRFRVLGRKAIDIGNKPNLGPAGQGTATLACTDANTVMTAGQGPFVTMTPGAARDLTLPAVAQSAGLFLFIANLAGATHAITVKNVGGTTICTIPATKRGVVWCDGTTWVGGPLA